MKLLNLESGTPFSMGKGKNWSVLNPVGGADRITLNHALHGSGHEFPQHIHDQSIDIILVLEGTVQLRQGEIYTPLEAGEAALIPAGEVHGTVNRSAGTARLISFQIPPDLALYRGERNKAEEETPRPQPGNESGVVILDLGKGSPWFLSEAQVRTAFSPEKGCPQARLDRILLSRGEAYGYTNAGIESVFILLAGMALLEHRDQSRKLSVFDVVFLHEKESVTLRNEEGQHAVFVHCRALV
jgi:mannose-6-phosphate isomerase-like protein (cupin superfamily)